MDDDREILDGTIGTAKGCADEQLVVVVDRWKIGRHGYKSICKLTRGRHG